MKEAEAGEVAEDEEEDVEEADEEAEEHGWVVPGSWYRKVSNSPVYPSMKVLKLGRVVGAVGAASGLARSMVGLLNSRARGSLVRWSRGPGLAAGVPYWAWIQGISGEGGDPREEGEEPVRSSRKPGGLGGAWWQDHRTQES